MSAIYRTAFVVQNTGYDFSDLETICENIRFITSGRESEDQLLDVINDRMHDFVPNMDLFVPVGNVVTNLLAGLVLFTLAKPLGDAITIALYKDRKYHIRVVSLAHLDLPTGETNE